jgi:hypothetical protein
MHPDDIRKNLLALLEEMKKQGDMGRFRGSILAALRFMDVAKRVRIDSDRGDWFLIEQLEEAATFCDSPLLEAASLRLRSLAGDVRRKVR